MKYSLTLLLLAVMSMPVVAVANDEKNSITDEQLNRMQQQLQLTDDQVTEMRQIRDDGGSRKEVRAVLTDEQKVRSKGRKHSVSDEQLNRMQEQLQLTDDQVAKMRQIRDEGGTRAEIRAVLTEEQKVQAEETRSERKKKDEKKAEHNSDKRE
jgi:cyanate lyase